MSDDEARDAFRMIRWSSTNGEPVCPSCGCLAIYTFKSRPIFKCKGCDNQFSHTSGTIFAHRKLPVRTYLLAVAIFVNGAKGHSALQLSRDLDCQYKTAFVMAHKIREALAAEKAGETVSGTVEVDGGYFGGYIKPSNYKENRRDRCLAVNQNGKRRVVVVARERGGKTVMHVFKSEAAGVATVASIIELGSTVHADEATHWDALHARFLTKRINHEWAYSDEEACTKPSRVVLLSLASRRDRHSSPYRGHVSSRLRRRNGLTRGQPPHLEWRAIFDGGQRGAGASGFAAMERLLAAPHFRTIKDLIRGLLSMIQIDLNAPSIPQNQRVWRLFPGSGYRFLESFRQQEVGYLDIPGFIFPSGKLSLAKDLTARVAASQFVADQLTPDATNAAMAVDLKDFDSARNSQFRGRLRQSIINFYEEAKPHDIVVTPEPTHMSRIWVGRFRNDTTTEALYDVNNPHFTIPARRINWLMSVRENTISSALSDSLRNQHPFSLLEKSLFIEVFSLAYSSFLYEGRHVATIFSGDDYLDSDSSLLGIISRIASATCYDVDHGNAPDLHDIISILINSPSIDYTCSQAIDIHSPGFIRYVSGKAVPWVIVAAVAALIALGDAPSKEAFANELANIEIVNDAAGADPQCTPPVHDATRRLLNTFDIDKTYKMCQELRAAQARNSLKPSATLKPKHP